MVSGADVKNQKSTKCEIALTIKTMKFCVDLYTCMVSYLMKFKPKKEHNPLQNIFELQDKKIS